MWLFHFCFVPVASRKKRRCVGKRSPCEHPYCDKLMHAIAKAFTLPLVRRRWCETFSITGVARIPRWISSRAWPWQLPLRALAPSNKCRQRKRNASSSMSRCFGSQQQAQCPRKRRSRHRTFQLRHKRLSKKNFGEWFVASLDEGGGKVHRFLRGGAAV